MESDPHNVHQFWGVSPAVDLLGLLHAKKKKKAGATTEELSLLSCLSLEDDNSPYMFFEVDIHISIVFI